MLVKVNGVSQYVVNTYNQIQSSNNLPLQSSVDIHSSLDGIVQSITNHHLSNSYDITLKLSDGSRLIVDNIDLPNVKVGDFVHQGDYIGHAHGFASEIIQKLNGDYLSVEQFKQGIQHATSIVHNNVMDSSISGIIEYQPKYTFKDLEYLSKMLNKKPQVVQKMVESNDSNNPFTIIATFIKDIKHEGLWYACTGEHFWSWCGHKLLAGWDWLSYWITKGFLDCNEVFFLFPAIILMFATIIIGKNKSTKFILPLWFVYALTEITRRILNM
jgi:hypothetical protein